MATGRALPGHFAPIAGKKRRQSKPFQIFVLCNALIRAERYIAGLDAQRFFLATN
jgi:hypothetical protein